MIFGFALTMLFGCGHDVEEAREREEPTVIEYESKTEEEQIERSKTDREIYKQAVAEGDASLCTQIAFHTLKQQCLNETPQ